MVLKSLLAIAVCVVVVAPASAQETRADAIAAEQAEKAKQLQPYQPTRAEEIALRAKHALVDTPSGLYPAFGSVMGGGGFALGAGYRQFTGDRAFIDLRGLFTIRAYKLFEFTTVSPGHLGDRVDLQAQAGWRDATQVGFYGLGIDSPLDRSNFRMKEGYASGSLLARPARFTVVGAALAYENYTIEDGRGAAPPVATKHTPLTAPGLG